MASSSRLRPGEEGQIRASVDVKGKLGTLRKSVKVHTNDPTKPLTKLFLKMIVKDTFHVGAFKAQEIFSERCRDCHVHKGKGKKGYALFRADCIMCHGRGKSASSIMKMRTKPREYIVKAITDGVDKTAMPGFDMKNGGPLTEEEIESLVDVIRPR